MGRGIGDHIRQLVDTIGEAKALKFYPTGKDFRVWNLLGQDAINGLNQVSHALGSSGFLPFKRFTALSKSLS